MLCLCCVSKVQQKTVVIVSLWHVMLHVRHVSVQANMWFPKGKPGSKINALDVHCHNVLYLVVFCLHVSLLSPPSKIHFM